MNSLTNLRRDHIGFVFQQGNLLPRFSVLENVEFPLAFQKRTRRDPGAVP